MKLTVTRAWYDASSQSVRLHCAPSPEALAMFASTSPKTPTHITIALLRGACDYCSRLVPWNTTERAHVCPEGEGCAAVVPPKTLVEVFR